MKKLKCAICNSAETSLVFKTRDYDSGGKTIFSVVKCNKCGLVYLNPQPDDRYLSQFYVFNYYGNQSFFHSIFLFINNFIIGNRAHSILKRKKGKIIDIGCGDGDFLKFMKDKGWDAYGIEPSKSGFEIAKSKIKENVYNKPLGDIKFMDKFFDAVTIEHVLEHVDNPKEMIKQVHRIMKDDGLLVISVPNIGSVQAKIGRDKWFHLDIPRHIYHFSSETLTRFLESNGFEVKKINYFSFVYNLIGVMQTFMNMIGIRFNFLHHLIKRVDRQKDFFNVSYIFNFLLTMVFSFIIFFPSLAFSIFESMIKRGATITVFAVKRK